ncbi:MAG: ribose 5-phosphate isomerase B [Chloroflexi bacterium]|nr:ribose 5-phosphate isomerase B [Chloroflexota bacterium]
MRIVLGADHAGYELKEEMKGYVEQMGYTVLDVGTDSTDSVDYPDFAQKVGEAVASGEAERGILICGSGIGASIAANKVPGVRAGLAHDTYSAAQGVTHDDMNVLTLGSRVIGVESARSLIGAFLGATFDDSTERYVRRLKKVLALEERYRSTGETRHE